MQTAEPLCSSPHACRAPLLARASCLGTEPWMGNQMWNVPKQVWNVLPLQPWGFPPARFSSRASLAKHLMNTAPFAWRWTYLVLLRCCLCLSWGWGCWILIITSITHHACNLLLETVWKVQLRIDTGWYSRGVVGRCCLTAQGSDRPCCHHLLIVAPFLFSDHWSVIFTLPSWDSRTDWSPVWCFPTPTFTCGLQIRTFLAVEKICWDTARKMPRKGVAEIFSPGVQNWTSRQVWEKQLKWNLQLNWC